MGINLGVPQEVTVPLTPRKDGPAAVEISPRGEGPMGTPAALWKDQWLLLTFHLSVTFQLAALAKTKWACLRKASAAGRIAVSPQKIQVE